MLYSLMVKLHYYIVKKYGFINKCAGNGYNIYGLPSKLHCFSYDFQTEIYMLGLNNINPSNKEDE